MSFIGSFAKGDWAKGLTEVFTGRLGGSILETARGNKTGGQLATEIGTDVATAAVSLIPGAGTAAAIGKAAATAAIQAGSTAAQGGTVGDVAKAAGLSIAGSAVGGALGKVATSIGNKVGQLTSKIGNKTNALTGGAASVADTATAGSTDIVKQGTTEMATQAQTAANNLGIKDTSALNIKGTAIDKTLPAGMTKQEFITSNATQKGVLTSASSTPTKAGSVLNTTKKVRGAVANVGVQLAGTALTAALSAKASSDANKVAQEGLDLQRSMYEEQKKERESKDAEHKASAVKARKMGLLFGETLYNSSSNNQILSGSSNNFSLLSIKRDVT